MEVSSRDVCECEGKKQSRECGSWIIGRHCGWALASKEHRICLAVPGAADPGLQLQLNDEETYAVRIQCMHYLQMEAGSRMTEEEYSEHVEMTSGFRPQQPERRMRECVDVD